MDENRIIIDATGIGQIGCSLIERISELCGWMYINKPNVVAKNSIN